MTAILNLLSISRLSVTGVSQVASIVQSGQLPQRKLWRIWQWLSGSCSFRSGSCELFGSSLRILWADPVDNLAVAERILCSGSWWACGSCVNFELSGSCFSGSCCADPAERILVSGSYERIRHVADPGVFTVIESKPPIILIYSKIFVFARSRRLGRVTSSYLGMFWMNTFPFTCKILKVQKVCIIY